MSHSAAGLMIIIIGEHELDHDSHLVIGARNHALDVRQHVDLCCETLLARGHRPEANAQRPGPGECRALQLLPDQRHADVISEHLLRPLHMSVSQIHLVRWQLVDQQTRMHFSGSVAGAASFQQRQAVRPQAPPDRPGGEDTEYT